MAANPSSRTVLVTGGAGYIGAVLARTLLGQGYRVRVLDALLYDNRSAVADLLDNRRFNFIHGDLCEESTVQKALEGVTDIVLLAALVGDPICKQYPDLTRRVNDIGTIRLIEQLHGRNINRLVFMSTCSNYGLRATDEEADENSLLNPQSLYAETKVKVERFLSETAGRLDFSATVLRCATAYGLSPRMRFDLTVNEFTRELTIGNELLVYDADTWRPYCHVTDIARAISLVIEAPPAAVAGRVFNVGSPGENYTKRMIVERLTAILPKAQVRYREGSVDPRNYKVDFSSIADLLNFRAKVQVIDFVSELIGVLQGGRFGDYEARRQFYRNCSVGG